jgi:hypothetical protein
MGDGPSVRRQAQTRRIEPAPHCAVQPVEGRVLLTPHTALAETASCAAPMKKGPTKPPRLPTELTTAIEQPRSEAGCAAWWKDQKMGMATWGRRVESRRVVSSRVESQVESSRVESSPVPVPVPVESRRVASSRVERTWQKTSANATSPIGVAARHDAAPLVAPLSMPAPATVTSAAASAYKPHAARKRRLRPPRSAHAARGGESATCHVTHTERAHVKSSHAARVARAAATVLHGDLRMLGRVSAGRTEAPRAGGWVWSYAYATARPGLVELGEGGRDGRGPGLVGGEREAQVEGWWVPLRGRGERE